MDFWDEFRVGFCGVRLDDNHGDGSVDESKSASRAGARARRRVSGLIDEGNLKGTMGRETKRGLARGVTGAEAKVPKSPNPSSALSWPF